ncbi:Uncharacterized protein dnm_002350 [Desulfonema magnum]|uniref:Uncharacterized protein n=1 Tax=Desulfonema magnum TaxID=45655 RepID=A0A975BF22_9BACT|nr:Uncharacterized protein dnm_002350 [Desulfonema magnum]
MYSFCRTGPVFKDRILIYGNNPRLNRRQNQSEETEVVLATGMSFF